MSSEMDCDLYKSLHYLRRFLQKHDAAHGDIDLHLIFKERADQARFCMGMRMDMSPIDAYTAGRDRKVAGFGLMVNDFRGGLESPI